MNCPVCDAKLREVNKMGVDVDICPDCKGVWLDRGELEKLLELAVNNGQAPIQQAPSAQPSRQEYRHDEHGEYRERESHDHDHDHDHDRYEKRRDERGNEIDPRTGRPRKRESFLTNIMDMFGGED